MMIQLILLLLWYCPVVAADGNETTSSSSVHDGEEFIEPGVAVLFPWFVMAISFLIFYLLTRYAKWLPYTAMCFLFGTLLGITNQNLDDADHLLHESIHEWWINIDSEVLLLTFLPGLVYKDASSLNVHLFQISFGQCLIFAFPMVLAGTTLTALVCYYILPYNWSFNLCMTAGSIMSATDPVAVSALLTELGAPNRLKTHISGESLLNDGSAIVFFTIFGLQLYLNEVGDPHLQEEGYAADIDLAEGVKTFVRMSLGAVAIGFVFALGVLVLFAILDRRLNREENVVEVALEFSMAYLCYFVAEVAWGTSGVIATVTMGILVAALGEVMVNDRKLRSDFGSIVEHMLNTVLFTLGGLVWGDVVANNDQTDNDSREFTARDWGYLVVLYIFLLLIRFSLFLLAFPLVSRIGLKSSPQEMIFQAFGGLRGAIGIALAIALDNIVRRADGDPKFLVETNKLFGFVGGISFMTLMINATTAGPVLRKLGLADTSSFREKILKGFRQKWRACLIDDMIDIVARQKCYFYVNFDIVRHHIPDLRNLSIDEISEALEIYQESTTAKPDNQRLNLQRIMDSIKMEQNSAENTESSVHLVQRAMEEVQQERKKVDEELDQSPTEDEGAVTERRSSMPRMKRLSVRHACNKLSLVELRRFFLELLRAAYDGLADNGELADREFVALTLLESIDLATDAVEHGKPLCDWELSTLVDKPMQQTFMSLKLVQLIYGWMENLFGKKLAHVGPEYALNRIRIERAIAFVHAHQDAQAKFRSELAVMNDYVEEGEVVLQESAKQVEQAQELMFSHDEQELETVVSHKFCYVLLLNYARRVEHELESGMLKATEAEEVREEIQELIHHVNSCDMIDHKDEASYEQ